MGYDQAGFEVLGVDHHWQPSYPFGFLQMDALQALLLLLDHGTLRFSNGRAVSWRDLAAAHASPPCLDHTLASIQWKKQGKQYKDLIEPTRRYLKALEVPYVIENVPRAPLINPTMLNGSLFGLRIRRRRLFETSFPLPLILIPPEERTTFRTGKKFRRGDMVTPVGHFSQVDYVREQMQIPWMNQKELSQAIPPAYTRLIGSYMMKHVHKPSSQRNQSMVY